MEPDQTNQNQWNSSAGLWFELLSRRDPVLTEVDEVGIMILRILGRENLPKTNTEKMGRGFNQ